MVLFRKPSHRRVEAILASQADLGFTYPAVGVTAGTPPPGYTVDRTRVRVGSGEAVYRVAVDDLRQWRQFLLGWVEAGPAGTPLRPGAVVAATARVFGLWWLNACRVVYVVEEAGPVHRFGFAYGTLPGHVEAGEERFLVEWDEATGDVWYDILAFSRPATRWPGSPTRSPAGSNDGSPGTRLPPCLGRSNLSREAGSDVVSYTPRRAVTSPRAGPTRSASSPAAFLRRPAGAC